MKQTQDIIVTIFRRWLEAVLLMGVICMTRTTEMLHYGMYKQDINEILNI